MRLPERDKQGAILLYYSEQALVIMFVCRINDVHHELNGREERGWSSFLFA